MCVENINIQSKDTRDTNRNKIKMAPNVIRDSQILVHGPSSI